MCVCVCGQLYSSKGREAVLNSVQVTRMLVNQRWCDMDSLRHMDQLQLLLWATLPCVCACVCICVCMCVCACVCVCHTCNHHTHIFPEMP